MANVKIKYTGGTPEIAIPAIGVIAKRGETVEVPANIAGRAPEWVPITDKHKDDTWNPRRKAKKSDEQDTEILDPGEGLLAQVEWEAEKTNSKEGK